MPILKIGLLNWYSSIKTENWKIRTIDFEWWQIVIFSSLTTLHWPNMSKKIITIFVIIEILASFWKVFKNSVDKMKKSPVEPASMTTAWTRGSSPNLSKICPICSWTVLGKNLEASEENKTVKVKTETSTKNTETIHLVKFRSIFAPLDSGLSDLEFGPPLSPENKKRFYKKQTPFNFYGKFWTISLNMST